jgi:hypothetical protein
MAVNEKTLKALESAKTYLENSIIALNKKDENSFASSIWHLAAELEYTLFLFSIIFQDESNILEWKPNPELKKVDVDTILAEVQNLLKEAEEHMANEKLQDAYKNAHIARHYILKIQEDIAKKKREALKKK